MRHRLGILLPAIALVASSPAWPQASLNPDNYTFTLGRPTTHSEHASVPVSENFLRDYLRQVGEASFAGAHLFTFADRLYGLERIDVSTPQLMLEGAGAGATLGMFMGAVGMTTGLFDEDTGWYITGAAAALGAFLNGTIGGDEPHERVRYRWRNDTILYDDRRH